MRKSIFLELFPNVGILNVVLHWVCDGIMPFPCIFFIQVFAILELLNLPGCSQVFHLEGICFQHLHKFKLLCLLVSIRFVIEHISVIVLLNQMQSISVFPQILVNECALHFFLFFQTHSDEVVSSFNLFLQVVQRPIFSGHDLAHLPFFLIRQLFFMQLLRQALLELIF